MKQFAQHLLLLAFLPAFALAQFTPTFKVGTGTTGGPGGWRTDALAASAATARMAFGFFAPVSCTIDEFCINIPSKTGTLASTDAVITIYSDSSGVPGSSLSSSTLDANTTGFKCATHSQAVVIGTQYWFDVTNANATPASNNFSVPTAPQNVAPGPQTGLTGSPGLGFQAMRSTDNGSTWTAGAGQRAAAAVIRVHCSSGAYYGFPATQGETPANPISTADRIYSTREVGNKWTTDASLSPRVKCVEFEIARIGTPTGKVYYRLYNGTTHVADTGTVESSGPQNSGGMVPLCFTSVQTLSPSTLYRMVIAETTQSDTSSNTFAPHRIDFDSNSNSLALKPMSGTIEKTICTGSCNGGSFTDTSTSYYTMNLILDPTQPFDASGGDAGPQTGLNKGFN